MAGFFTRLANRLWRSEQHARTLTHTLQALVMQVLERGEQGKDMVNLRTPLLPARAEGPCVEFSLLRKSVVERNKELGKLFAAEWGKHVKEYMITASIPKPDGGRDLYFLAAYDRPWEDMDRGDLRLGLIGGVAVEFHEDLEAAMRWVRG